MGLVPNEIRNSCRTSVARLPRTRTKRTLQDFFGSTATPARAPVPSPVQHIGPLERLKGVQCDQRVEGEGACS